MDLKNKLLLTFGAIAVFFVVLILLAGGSSGKVYEDDSSPVMYFYSPTCSHCIAMTPILEKLGSSGGFRVKPMNVKANPSYWTQYSVEGTPTWVAANGDRIVGEQTEVFLRVWLESHGAKIK
ncbi:MAG: thioredoxin family protein [Candidatus Micrarchaeia archaeon]